MERFPALTNPIISLTLCFLSSSTGISFSPDNYDLDDIILLDEGGAATPEPPDPAARDSG